jgi:hypothetical protein
MVLHIIVHVLKDFPVQIVVQHLVPQVLVEIQERVILIQELRVDIIAHVLMDILVRIVKLMLVQQDHAEIMEHVS